MPRTTYDAIYESKVQPTIRIRPPCSPDRRLQSREESCSKTCCQKFKLTISRSTHVFFEGRLALLTPHNVPRSLCDVRRASRSCNCRLNPTPVSFALTGNYIPVRSCAPNSICFQIVTFGFRSARLTQRSVPRSLRHVRRANRRL